MFSDLIFRLRSLLRRNAADKELDDELRFHFEREAEKYMRSGMAREEALRRARLAFGGVEQIKDDCREARGVLLIETFFQDARYSLLMLRKSPGFTAVAVLTLALGIGANTAIFSVVQGVLLAPLKYSQPDRLVMVYQSNPRFPRVWISYLNFRDWQRNARSFGSMTAFHSWQGYDLTNPGPAEHIDAKAVSAGFFATLGLKLALGREFTAQEDQLGGAPAVILGDRLWRSRFHSHPDALGKTLTLSGVDYAIIGVAPPGPALDHDASVYTPLGQSGPQFLNYRAAHQISCLARLKPGVSLSQARAEMAAIQKNLDTLYPQDDRDLGTYVEPLKQDLVGDAGGVLLLLLGAVGLVLLIACANVASLLLARSAARAREFAIRSALGASRARMIRQLLTESVLLALTGGSLGVAMAAWGIQPALAALPSALPRSQEIGVNVPVLIFAFALAVTVGILFGLAPALKNSKNDLQPALKEGGRTYAGRGQRGQSALVVAQMAITLVLLAGAGLLLRTLRDLVQVNAGFDVSRLITFKVGVSHSLTKTAAGTQVAYEQLIERIRKVPGVEAADFTDVVPLSGESGIEPFWIGSQKPASLQAAPRLLMFMTGPDYLRTMGIPLLRGRFFTAADTAQSPCVTVIDRDFVRLNFPHSDPIGQTLSAGFASFGPCTIVGVVGHVRHWGLTEPGNYDMGEAYVSRAQDPAPWVQANYAEFSVMARTHLKPASVMPAIAKAVYQGGEDQPVYQVETMRQMAEDSMSGQRFPFVLLGAFAVLALLLASLGVYGLIAYSVAQRIREIGIRFVLGARRADVFRMIAGQGLRLAIAGIAMGAAGAMALTHLLKSFSNLLFGVGPNDPATFVTAAIVLAGVAILACYIPARRAMRVDPMVSLRYE